MASIVDNFDGRSLQLGNEEFVRTMQWGSNWNMIRFGMRFIANGTASILAQRLQLGLCVGSAGGFSSASCVQYVGSIFGFPSAAWTYDVNGFYLCSGSIANNTQVATKVGTTITDITTGGGLNQCASAAASSKMGAYVTEITRLSTTSVSVRHTFADSTAVQTACTFYAFMRFLESEGTTSANGIGTFTNARTVSGLSSYDLNTFSVYWNHSTPTIEISDICAVRFY